MKNSDSDETNGKHTLDFMKNRVCSYYTHKLFSFF